MKTKKRTMKSILILATVLGLSLMSLACIEAPIEEGPISNLLSPTHPVTTPLPTDEDEQTEPADDESNEDESAAETTESESQVPGTSSRAKESTLTVELEGMLEEVPALLYESDLGYSFYYDSDRYEVIRSQPMGRAATLNIADELGLIDVDLIRPQTPAAELPDVYAQIGKVSDLTLNDAAEKMHQALSDAYPHVTEIETVLFGEASLGAKVFTARQGQDWDDELVTVYVVSAGDSDVCLVFNVHFIGAAEGHGSRLQQMLDTFRLE